jgi:hypothetical protein
LICSTGFQREISQLVLVGIADHCRHSRQRCNLLWRSLGVTTGDYDLATRILTMNATDRRTRILIGGSGNCAGVQDDNLGVVG